MCPMTYERWQRKQLRRSFSTTGWTLVIYYLIMNVAVFFAAIVEMIFAMMNELASGNLNGFQNAAARESTGGWGYILTLAVGLLILLVWKKPRFWKEEIWAKGKPMTFGSFVCILCFFISGQSVYQTMTTTVELFLNSLGLTMIEGLEAMSLGMDSFDMFLYAAILAPIAEEIWAEGKPMTFGSFVCRRSWAFPLPMTFGSFVCILCFFISGQSVYQTMTTTVELFLNSLGLTMIEGLEAMSLGMDSFDMFLYAAILAPIAEEILFRGLIQRTLMPYGRKFAIFCSSFAFGMFHGNLLQSPYAFLVGLVLGYTAAEYSIGWAMVLHMINNLVIADILTRLTAGMSEIAAGVLITAIISVFTICAIVIAVVKRRQISAYLRQERMSGLYLKCFFTSPGMIVLMVLMVISMIVTTFAMVTPL